MLGGRSRTTRQIENEIDQVGAGRRCGMGTEVCDSDSAASHATVVPGAGPRGGAMVQGPSKGRTVSPWPRMIPRGTPTAQEQFRCEANRMLTIGARKSRCWRVGGWAGVCVLWPGPCAPGRCRSGSPLNIYGPALPRCATVPSPPPARFVNSRSRSRCPIGCALHATARGVPVPSVPRTSPQIQRERSLLLRRWGGACSAQTLRPQTVVPRPSVAAGRPPLCWIARGWRVGGWAGVCVLRPGACAPGRHRSGPPFNF